MTQNAQLNVKGKCTPNAYQQAVLLMPDCIQDDCTSRVCEMF